VSKIVGESTTQIFEYKQTIENLEFAEFLTQCDMDTAEGMMAHIETASHFRDATAMLAQAN
jgi:hypothetical protein